ncbi:MAG TPA: SIR2 family protein [Candidatus Acidoferrales bacterium]|nr:SIR2 family protein [Candidatus Acidoferrales bacterium]
MKPGLVILFGAGATRGALLNRAVPPPVDRDFFDIASQLRGRGTGRLASRVMREVFDLYRHVSGVGLEEYFRDIEARAEIGEFAKPSNQPKNWAKRQADLVELVRRVMVLTTGELGDQESAIHRRILGRLRPGDAVITFNYDMMVEEAIPNEGPRWNPSDGYGLQAGGVSLTWATRWQERHGNIASGSSQFRILKLHGSINWTLYATNEVRLKPRPYVVRARKGVAVSDKCAVLPPGWHKRINVNPYRKLWRKARLALEHCRDLAIIGYSLPDTDPLARALLAEVCRSRAARGQFLRRLHLADPDDHTKERFCELFAPALGAKGHVYRYDGIGELGEKWRGVQR